MRYQAGLDFAGDGDFLLEFVPLGRFGVKLVVDHGRGRLLGNAKQDAQAAVAELVGRDQPHQHDPHETGLGVEGQGAGLGRAHHLLQPVGHFQHIMRHLFVEQLSGQNRLGGQRAKLFAREGKGAEQTRAHFAQAVAGGGVEKFSLFIPHQHHRGAHADQHRHKAHDET